MISPQFNSVHVILRRPFAGILPLQPLHVPPKTPNEMHNQQPLPDQNGPRPCRRMQLLIAAWASLALFGPESFLLSKLLEPLYSTFWRVSQYLKLRLSCVYRAEARRRSNTALRRRQRMRGRPRRRRYSDGYHDRESRPAF